MELNEQIKDWKLDTIFGDNVPQVSDFKGQPLLILFFSLGCPGCKSRALPFANRMVYENEQDLKVIGIHTRFKGPTYELEAIEKVKKEYHVRFPFYKDANGMFTFNLYQAGGTPHWILIDKDGKVVYSIFGSDPNNALLRLDLKINELLEKQ
jgi:peroxiredoxin